jgi:hypothetical protein
MQFSKLNLKKNINLLSQKDLMNLNKMYLILNKNLILCENLSINLKLIK